MSFLEAMDRFGKSTTFTLQADSGYHKRTAVGRLSRLPLKQSASIDLLKTKIDDWDLHTSDLDGSLIPSSAMKRSMSDTGPRRATSRCSDAHVQGDNVQGKSVPVIQVAASCDDVFGIEADGFQSHEAAILMKRIARTEKSPVILGGLGPRTAPGGGEWI